MSLAIKAIHSPSGDKANDCRTPAGFEVVPLAVERPEAGPGLGNWRTLSGDPRYQKHDKSGACATPCYQVVAAMVAVLTLAPRGEGLDSRMFPLAVDIWRNKAITTPGQRLYIPGLSSSITQYLPQSY